MEIWEIKLKEYFENAVVDKELMQKFESFKLPRFVSEYIVQQFIEEHGFEKGIIKIEEFLNNHYPKSTATDFLHYKIQEEGEINIIDNFKVNVHIEKHGDDHTLNIPSINIKNAKVSDKNIILNNPRLLNSGLWGMGKIRKGEDSKRVNLSKLNHFK